MSTPKLHNSSARQTNAGALGRTDVISDEGHLGQVFDDVSGLFGVFDMAMRRPRVGWRDLEPMNLVEQDDPKKENYKLNLHFGGGFKSLTGFVEIDYPAWDAEACVAQPIGAEQVDNIVVIHTLDHLSSRAVQFFLADAHRMLKVGGIITIVVPHHMSTLAHECIEHKTQYGLKTWRNMLSGGNDMSVDMPDHLASENDWVNGSWRQGLKVGFNMIMGLEERNLVLVTQLIKES